MKRNAVLALEDGSFIAQVSLSGEMFFQLGDRVTRTNATPYQLSPEGPSPADLTSGYRWAKTWLVQAGDVMILSPGDDRLHDHRVGREIPSCCQVKTGSRPTRTQQFFGGVTPRPLRGERVSLVFRRLADHALRTPVEQVGAQVTLDK